LRIIIFTLLFSGVVFAQSPGTEHLNLCLPDTVSANLESSWKQGEHGTCIKLVCVQPRSQFRRERCYRKRSSEEPNTVVISNADELPNGYMLKGISLILGPTLDCYDECKPESRKFLMFTLRPKQGLERKSCHSCLAKLPIYVDDTSYKLPETGQMLFAGSKCWDVCHYKAGQFLDQRILSESCRQCVGLDGLSPEKFKHVQTKSGECIEIDDLGDSRSVASGACAGANPLYTTEFKKITTEKITGFMSSSIESNCLEVDESSGGKVFRRAMDDEFCITEAVNDSGRSGSKESAASKAITPKASGSRQ